MQTEFVAPPKPTPPNCKPFFNGSPCDTDWANYKQQASQYDQFVGSFTQAQNAVRTQREAQQQELANLKKSNFELTQRLNLLLAKRDIDAVVKANGGTAEEHMFLPGLIVGMIATVALLTIVHFVRRFRITKVEEPKARAANV